MDPIYLLIFAKYAKPGTVKTRMIPTLTATEAAALHLASLHAVCETVSRIEALCPILVVTPDDRAEELLGQCSAHLSKVWPQGDGDLGDRLTRATHRAFAEGAASVVFIGADSPTSPASRLIEAIKALEAHEAVLGPCDDGGYYLLGMRRELPALFEDIDWGGPQVAKQTLLRGQKEGVDLHQLPLWYDLDRFEDLQRAVRDLVDVDESSLPAAAALRRLLTTYTER